MNWQEIIAARLDEREKGMQAPRKNAGITYPLTDHELLFSAAQKRGMKLGTYARAALYAFAAFDMGEDVDTMLGFLPSYGKSVGNLLGGAEERTDTRPTSGHWAIVALGGKNHGAED